MRFIYTAIFLLIIMVLNSCVPAYEYYLRNFLSEEVAIVARFNSRSELDRWLKTNSYMLVDKDVTNYAARALSFKDSIPVERLNDTIAMYVMPAHSVVSLSAQFFQDDPVNEYMIKGGSFDKKVWFTGNQMYLTDNKTGKVTRTKFKCRLFWKYFFDIKQ